MVQKRKVSKRALLYERAGESDVKTQSNDAERKKRWAL